MWAAISAAADPFRGQPGHEVLGGVDDLLTAAVSHGDVEMAGSVRARGLGSLGRFHQFAREQIEAADESNPQVLGGGVLGEPLEQFDQHLEVRGQLRFRPWSRFSRDRTQAVMTGMPSSPVHSRKSSKRAMPAR